MKKSATVITTARQHANKVVLSLTLAATMVFSFNSQASAQVDSLSSFMSAQAENISTLAHPTAKFLGSTYEGNGVITIYYRGFEGNRVLRIQGSLDYSGNFDDLSVISDNGYVAPFTAVSMMRELLGESMNDWVSNADSSLERTGASMLQEAVRRGNGETMCEAYLFLASL